MEKRELFRDAIENENKIQSFKYANPTNIQRAFDFFYIYVKDHNFLSDAYLQEVRTHVPPLCQGALYRDRLSDVSRLSCESVYHSNQGISLERAHCLL